MNFLIKLWPWILLKVWKEPGNININQRMKREIMEVEAKLENENDEDWVNLRHLHIIESSELIFQ